MSALTLDEGREGEWNRGRPPRAQLALAVLCARAAATRSRRVGGGGRRINAENDEKVAAGGIAAAVSSRAACVRLSRACAAGGRSGPRWKRRTRWISEQEPSEHRRAGEARERGGSCRPHLGNVGLGPAGSRQCDSACSAGLD